MRSVSRLSVHGLMATVWLIACCLPGVVVAQNFELTTVAAGLAENNSRDHNGISVADYDMDGDLDVYIVAFRQYDPDRPNTWNRLYRNDGSGQFTDVTEAAGVLSKIRGYNLGGMGNKFGASWGDYDNDGDPDLFLTSIGPEILFRNEGDGTFVNATEEAGLTQVDDNHSSSSVWWDYDQDGDLDLYISAWAGTTSANFLYENDGAGKFIDVTETAGLGDTGRTWTSIPLDANNDGLTDLYVVNDFGPNKFYVNQGDKTFLEATAAFGLEDEGHGMGVTVGDYNNDGFFDIYLTNIAEYYPNPLFLNNGDGTFTELGERMGVHDAGWAWGTEFFDCDNDGDLDLYAANGYLIDQGTNHFFVNGLIENNYPHFLNQSEESGADGEAEARGLVVFDYDDDGDLDVMVANWGEAPSLYTNQSQALNWLKVDLKGTESNTNAFGATLRVSVGNKTFYRHNDGVEFLGQSIQPVHFGVGYATQIDELTITWPTGKEESYYNIPANQTISIVEGQQTATSNEDPTAPGAVQTFELYSAYPNPFTDATAVSFYLPHAGAVDLTVYNILGQEVMTARKSFAGEGRYEMKLNASELGNNGMYIYRLRWEDSVKTGVISKVR